MPSSNARVVTAVRWTHVRHRARSQSRPANVKDRQQSAGFRQRGRHLRPHSPTTGGTGQWGSPQLIADDFAWPRGSRILLSSTDHGDHHSQESRTPLPITASNSSVTSVISRREKPSSRRGDSTEPNCQVAHSPVAADVRRNNRRRWAEEARPNQRGRNMGLARGVDGPSLGLFSWGGYFGWEGGGSSSAVQCSAFAVGCQSDLLEMQMRNACEMGVGKTVGGRKPASLFHIEKVGEVVVVLGRLGLISLAGDER